MIRLRPADDSDEWNFWELRRQIQPDLTREAHLAWWTEGSEHRWVAYDGPARVGVIRVSPLPWEDGIRRKVGTVGILVAQKERGKGFGNQMLISLKKVARDLGFTRLQATVGPENTASQRAFLGAGYQPVRFEVEL